MNLKALARTVISLNHTKKTHNSELNLHYHIYPEDYNNHSIKTTKKQKGIVQKNETCLWRTRTDPAFSFRSEIEKEEQKYGYLQLGIAFKWQARIPSAIKNWKVSKIDYPFVSNTKNWIVHSYHMLFNLPFSLEIQKETKRKYFEDLLRHLLLR